MTIEFKTPEEYELFKRVMDRVKAERDGVVRGGAMPDPMTNGTRPFSFQQEQELLHKPEIGATRFSDGVPILAPKNSGELPDPTDHYEGEVLQLTADDGWTTDTPPVRAIDWGWLKMRVPA